MLNFSNVDICVAETPVLNDINLTINDGELHILFGPNGSGKSSLLSSIMGISPFRVVKGETSFNGQIIDKLPIDERAKLGIGLAFQRPPSLEGISIADLAISLDAEKIFNQELKNLDLQEFVNRDINVGFSGGEIKRWEVLKLFLQDPQLLLFDEPESGVDLEHVTFIGDAIKRLIASKTTAGKTRSGLIITHTGLILNYVDADVGHILKNGKIIYSGEPKAIFKHIQQNGYTAPIDKLNQ